MRMDEMLAAIDVIRRAQVGAESLDDGPLLAAIDEVVETTADTYTRESKGYESLRESRPWVWDEYLNTTLLKTVRSRIANGSLKVGDDGRWRLLDVGAGYGRDVIRLQREPDINAVALENSPGFVAALRAAQGRGDIAVQGVVAADMRDMSPIPDGSFHCVRNHATLHHLPVVGAGLGADIAVAECRRVLVKGGVFYVLVKAGDGISMIDTDEGLGGRFFQLFSREMLEALLSRNGFSITQLETEIEDRPSGPVDWIFALAIAV
jgi:SAM-dependent methyltransferase